MEHFIEVDDNPEHVAAHKDNDNAHEDHGDALVPLVSCVGPLVVGAGGGDGSVQQGVGDGEDEEGEKCHDNEVCQENVALDIERVVPHLCCTNGDGDVVILISAEVCH